MKTEIKLKFNEYIESTRKMCENSLIQESIEELYRNLQYYERHFSSEIRRILQKNSQTGEIFDINNDEVYPSEIDNFIIMANRHIENIVNFYKKILEMLIRKNPTQQNLISDNFVEQLDKSLQNDLENLIEICHIKKCVLSQEELWHRYYINVAKVSGKIIITFGIGAFGMYLVPYLLVASASTTTTIVSYAATNCLTSGIAAVACNSIDGKQNTELLDNVPRAMIQGAIAGGVLGGINSSISHGTSVTPIINTAEKKIAVVNMKLKAGESIANTSEVGIKAFSINQTFFYKTSSTYLNNNTLCHSQQTQLILQRLHLHIHSNMLSHRTSLRLSAF